MLPHPLNWIHIAQFLINEYNTYWTCAVHGKGLMYRAQTNVQCTYTVQANIPFTWLCVPLHPMQLQHQSNASHLIISSWIRWNLLTLLPWYFSCVIWEDRINLCLPALQLLWCLRRLHPGFEIYIPKETVCLKSAVTLFLSQKAKHVLYYDESQCRFAELVGGSVKNEGSR